MIKVVTQNMTGDTWSLETSLDSSVAELKEQLQLSTGMKAGSQQLLCKAQRLTGVEILKDLVEEQDTLTLTLLQASLKGVASSSEDGSILVWSTDDHDQSAVRTLQPARTNSAVYCLLQLEAGQLLSGGADSKIYLWDIASGDELRTFEGHTMVVWCLNHFAHDQFLSGSGDMTVRLWSLRSETALKCYKGHTDFVRYVIDFSAISANVTCKFLSTSDDQSIKLWDSETRGILKTWTGHSGYVWHILPVGEGRFLTTSQDRTIREWDVSTDAHIRVFTGHGGSVYCSYRSMDGILWTGSDTGEVFSWNFDAGELQEKWWPNGLYCVHELLPVSDTTVACTSGSSVLLLDLASREVRTLKGKHTQIVQGLAVVDLVC